MSIDAWPTSVWVAAALGPLAAHLLYGFIQQDRRRAGVAIAAAFLAHLGLSRLVPDAPGTIDSAPRLMEIELLEAPPKPAVRPAPEQPEPEQPEPEQPEPEQPEPEQPEPEQPKPEAEQSKPRARRPANPKAREAHKSEPRPPSAPAQQPPGPKRFDASQLNRSGDSGVSVHHGTTGGPTLDGDARHGGGMGRGPMTDLGTSEGTGNTGATGPAWAPASQVFVHRLPMPRSVPKKECPATKDGVQGTVFLKVQIRRDGTVRRVKLVKGIGHGCDAIAIAALKRAKFRPAKSNANESVDFEIRYEYAFRLAQ